MSLSPATYRFLADVLVVLHLGFVAFVVLGGLLVLRWRKLAWVHLPCAAWGALISFAGWICPLTPLEQHLRELGDEAGYEGGFVEHYVTSVLYPEGLTAAMQVGLGVFVIAVNAFVYLRVFRRRPPSGSPA